MRVEPRSHLRLTFDADSRACPARTVPHASSKCLSGTDIHRQPPPS